MSVHTSHSREKVLFLTIDDFVEQICMYVYIYIRITLCDSYLVYIFFFGRDGCRI